MTTRQVSWTLFSPTLLYWLVGTGDWFKEMLDLLFVEDFSEVR